MTSDPSFAESGHPHVLVIVLKNGSKYEAELKNSKYTQPYMFEIELSAQTDFQPSLVCTKKKIKEVYLEAKGNVGWYIAAIVTYTRTNKKPYTKLTTDLDFNKSLDGNGAYPYNAKRLVLTKSRKKSNKH